MPIALTIRTLLVSLILRDLLTYLVLFLNYENYQNSNAFSSPAH